MALVLDLKPGERVIIGETLITNDQQRTRLHIEGTAPILREKDIIRPEEADTPCKNLYLTLQLMYLDPEPERFHAGYFELVQKIQDETSTFKGPATAPLNGEENITSWSYITS